VLHIHWQYANLTFFGSRFIDNLYSPKINNRTRKLLLLLLLVKFFVASHLVYTTNLQLWVWRQVLLKTQLLMRILTLIPSVFICFNSLVTGQNGTLRVPAETNPKVTKALNLFNRHTPSFNNSAYTYSLYACICHVNLLI